jgi:rod shape-determining protein MreC
METSRDDFVIAIRSAFLKKGTQQRFSILGLIFFSIIILILGSFNFKPINILKKAIKELVYTSSFIVSVPENFIKSTYANTNYHFTHYKTHLEMKDELEKLKSKDLNYQIINLENIKYKKLVDDYFIKDNETFAKVLIDKKSPFLRSIIINKGSKNNIKLGMIALEEDYLVGKVVEVNFFTSRILLISDINSKIPVSLQPGDFQAILSGKKKQKGSLQYIQSENLKNVNGDLQVVTSGAGRVFKSGIPVGKIKFSDNFLSENEKIVDFYADFSQLKYVRIVSYSKEQESLDQSSKIISKKVEEEIAEENQQQETLRILLEQKKIAEEIRVKIEEENTILKKKVTKLESKVEKVNQSIKKQKIKKADIEFLELNLLYSNKCTKTFLKNYLYKVGTPEYRKCILNRGVVKKN